MSTVAAEITKQITATEITKLLRQTFTSNASAFAQSFKSIAYTETKTAFNNEFFAKIFVNAVNSGAIDELVKSSIDRSIATAFESKKTELSATGTIFTAATHAFFALTAKKHNPSNFWSELNAMVKPAAAEPLRKDINTIIEALNTAPETGISIIISEKNIIDAISAGILKRTVINVFEKTKSCDNINQSICALHSKVVESIIETAYSEANGTTIDPADEFEDDFYTDDNALEFRIERLRKDIRTGLANAFTKLIGAKSNHPCRPNYVNSLTNERELTEMITKEAFAALQNAAGDILETTIKDITSTIAKNIDSIVKRYEHIVIEGVKRYITAGCTSNGKAWNDQQMECIREPLDRVVKEQSSKICSAIASIIKRSVCGSLGVNAIKKCLDGIKSMEAGKMYSLMNKLRCIIQDGQKDAKSQISSIIDIICGVLKIMYNEVYKMDKKRLARLTTEGVL
jgi:hypothetical protein